MKRRRPSASSSPSRFISEELRKEKRTRLLEASTENGDLRFMEGELIKTVCDIENRTYENHSYSWASYALQMDVMIQYAHDLWKLPWDEMRGFQAFCNTFENTHEAVGKAKQQYKSLLHRYANKGLKQETFIKQFRTLYDRTTTIYKRILFTEEEEEEDG